MKKGDIPSVVVSVKPRLQTADHGKKGRLQTKTTLTRYTDRFCRYVISDRISSILQTICKGQGCNLR